MVFVFISDACYGHGEILSGEEGLIWMSAPLYKNTLYCQWHISVAVGKVSIAHTLSAVYINTKLGSCHIILYVIWCLKN